jgi:hypothetical protein
LEHVSDPSLNRPLTQANFLQMITEYKVDQGLLPPKHVFGVKNEAFLKKRQVDLEVSSSKSSITKSTKLLAALKETTD